MKASPFDLAGYTVRSHAAGLDTVMAYVTGSTGSVRVTPLIHNLLIELDGESATSNCMMTNRIFPGGAQMIGEYDDSFRLENAWRFTRRVYTILVDRNS